MLTHVQPTMLLFLQISVVLVTCRALGAVLRRFGQPQVVAEMLAGILLGPSLLGWIAPQVEAHLFPPSSLVPLHTLAQVGLTLYMFIVGLDFRTDIVKRQLGSAMLTSFAGIAAPFGLAAWLALTALSGDRYFGATLPSLERVMFFGACISITAFPMLARIVHECRLSDTRIGTLALAAGAVNDAIAWCFLAAVLATLNGSPSGIWLTLIGGGAFSFFMLRFGPALLGRLIRPIDPARFAFDPDFALVLCVVAACSWAADQLGIHAVFGAFLVGLAFPRGDALLRAREAIEPLCNHLLVPLFFVYSGLNTRMDLILEPALMGVTAMVIVTAFVGKGVACGLAAKAGGFSTPDAIAVGALMNARGTMELIILNIGLERNVITPAFFAIMVMMALLTNLTAVPVLEWTRRSRRPNDGDDDNSNDVDRLAA